MSPQRSKDRSWRLPKIASSLNANFVDVVSMRRLLRSTFLSASPSKRRTKCAKNDFVIIIT
jgi:hypothetical protein